MAADQPRADGEANEADVAEQTTPVDPGSPVESEAPVIAFEADDADVVEQAAALGPDDPDEYPPGDR